MEKARHRAEEYAQELKHAAQEKLHACPGRALIGACAMSPHL